jgi:hypothetical protein
MPADAVPDKYDYVFIYEKDGVKKEFPVTALPDSTWKFADRKQKLIAEGKNNIPLINDFSITSVDGVDSTLEILSANEDYYLLFIKEAPDNVNKWMAALKDIYTQAAAANKKIFVVTAQRDAIRDIFYKNGLPTDRIYTCDATAIKTAARTNPALYLMHGPVVANKWSWADFDEVK